MFLPGSTPLGVCNTDWRGRKVIRSTFCFYESHHVLHLWVNWLACLRLRFYDVQQRPMLYSDWVAGLLAGWACMYYFAFIAASTCLGVLDL